MYTRSRQVPSQDKAIQGMVPEIPEPLTQPNGARDYRCREPPRKFLLTCLDAMNSERPSDAGHKAEPPVMMPTCHMNTARDGESREVQTESVTRWFAFFLARLRVLHFLQKFFSESIRLSCTLERSVWNFTFSMKNRWTVAAGKKD